MPNAVRVPIVLPIASGWLQRDPAYATVTMRPLPSLHTAPLLSPATWFAWAVDAASVYLAERGAR